MKGTTMAQITASLVKELREMTGAGMMECKKALVEADGNLDAAVDVLRTAGLAAAAKKAGRATDEGTVMALVSEDGSVGALVELDCETDFVAMNDKFVAYAQQIAQCIIDTAPADMDALQASEIDGVTVGELLTDAIHTIGENIQMPRFARMSEEGGAVASYIHGAGKIGVLVSFKLGNPATASNPDFQRCGRDVAMQVAAASPVSARRDSVPAETVEHEMGIYKAQAAESGKPEAIQEKIATGRLEKFYKENCLTEQDFVKNPDQTVSEYTAEIAKQIGDIIEIVDFTRFMLGE
jgi:elongation factor Ts